MESEIQRLIELYREQENLYNINLKDYFDRNKQRESLHYIALAMGARWTGKYSDALSPFIYFKWRLKMVRS